MEPNEIGSTVTECALKMGYAEMYQNNFSRRETLLRLGTMSLVALSGTKFSQAQSQQTLRFVATGTFPPFNMQSENGKIIGMYADLLEEISKKINIKYEYRAYPWLRAQKMVEDGEADGFITIPTEQRNKYAVFVDKPVFSTGGPALITMKTNQNNSKIKAVKSLQELRQYRIGDYRGNSIGDSIHKDWTEKQIVGDISSLLKLLSAGRIDYTIQNEYVVKYFAKKEGILQDIEVTKLPFKFTESQDYYIGIRKSLPQSDALISQIGAAQDALIRSGFIERMLLNY